MASDGPVPGAEPAGGGLSSRGAQAKKKADRGASCRMITQTTTKATTGTLTRIRAGTATGTVTGTITPIWTPGRATFVSALPSR